MIVTAKAHYNYVQRCFSLVNKIKPVSDECLVSLTLSPAAIFTPVELRSYPCIFTQNGNLILNFGYAIPSYCEAPCNHIFCISAA